MGPKENRVAEFYWAPLPDLWSYAANRLGEVIESLADIDIAMMAGFNWQLGPFAMWDAAGVENTVASMRAMNKPIPQAVETLLASGGTSWYRADGSEYFDVIQKRYLVVPRSPRELLIEHLRASHTLRGNRSVSLIDLGDGVACLELHSKMNSLWRNSARFLEETLAARGTSDAVRGFVIGTVADHFSALT
jgi:3-hydroxyacyl-CoA dehydrogenase